jgi:hypothetical protein
MAEVGLNFCPDLLRAITRAREMNRKYISLSFPTIARADLPRTPSVFVNLLKVSFFCRIITSGCLFSNRR